MNTQEAYRHFGSAVIHAGHAHDAHHAHLTPIYATSTYVFDSAEQGMRRFSGEEEGYIYGRFGNPTSTEAEARITALETWGTGIEAVGILHASGMAALTTLFLSHLKAGDKVLSHGSLYGGTEELLRKVLPPLGIELVLTPMHNVEETERVIQSTEGLKMLYLETPANPTLQCVDGPALCALGKKYGLTVACDNTFATPYLQQPLAWGADLVMHSTTKYLNGHGTAIGGILIGRNLEMMRTKVTKTHRLLGGNANPFDAFLLVNGLKTLELRMERHCNNAEAVAKFLAAHPAVEAVNYPGLATHPQHAIAARQMRRFGAMLSFELRGGVQAGIDCMNRLRMCTRTVSLGTPDTLLCHPASMTHYGVAREERLRSGITDGLVRMHVGLEAAEDIIADLGAALGI